MQHTQCVTADAGLSHPDFQPGRKARSNNGDGSPRRRRPWPDTIRAAILAFGATSWLAAADGTSAATGAGASPRDTAPELADWLARLGLEHVPLPMLTGLQFTMIRQHLYPLNSPYASNLSLPADGDTANSYTYGVYTGWEPLRHLQLYLDIELFQGGGIGNVTGLGSLTNGDPIRQGASSLPKTPYAARKYLRYVLPLSDSSHEVERAQDSLPGQEADTRLEFKLGTMAAPDDFDKNRYANSTRTQFENWSLFQNTAWDYAADTRGYSGGLMIGYISPAWSLRYGIYQMPRFANGQPLDSPITHANGQQLELTLQQPRDNGWVVRALVYQNTARMGLYREALAIGQANGTTPDIVADDKPYRRKYGFALNGELPLADDGETGLFARVGWNDGRTESFAFTQVDRLVTFGGQLDGVHWARPSDRLGLAYVIGNLSGPQEEYLAAGGLGFVVGDGRIDYGAERVLESYYRFEPFKGVQLSGDFQRIDNPGYNKDRGPANVIGFRIHLEY
ncbi:MAG: carbohydrate porin [Nevskia sp.]|nr:carbohydrate porin [Nevskia sp.]